MDKEYYQQQQPKKTVNGDMKKLYMNQECTFDRATWIRYMMSIQSQPVHTGNPMMMLELSIQQNVHSHTMRIYLQDTETHLPTPPLSTSTKKRDISPLVNVRKRTKPSDQGSDEVGYRLNTKQYRKGKV